MKKLFPKIGALTCAAVMIVWMANAQQAPDSLTIKNPVAGNDTISLPLTTSAAATDTTPNETSANNFSFLYGTPHQYQIAGITVSGAKYLDKDLLISISGIAVGDKIVLPGDGLAKVINNLWKQDLFSNVQILISKIDGDNIYLDLHVTERPRLAKFQFKGVSKTQADELKTKTYLTAGKVVTENTKLAAIAAIRKYFAEKGYRNVEVKITERPDNSGNMLNTVDLIFNIDKGNKVKVNQISFAGNNMVPDDKLKKQMKGTHENTRLSFYSREDPNVYDPQPRSFKKYLKEKGFLSPSKTLDALEPYFRFRLFSSAKFDEQKYEEDKDKIIAYYNTLGYRDAVIKDDTLINTQNGNVDIDIKVQEGHQYYFGNITWTGNTKYSDSILNLILRIKKGDIYNRDLLDKRLGTTPTPEGGDISSLYLDQGYLFFTVTPIESAVYNDTIDFELRIREGAQADINRVTITGNDKTNEHVVRRELRTVPGDKFSRDEIIRSQREISQLGMFNPEKVTPNVQPNQNDGTADIGWSVEEKPSDQLQLSAGWGGYIGFTGTVGITFNNFSLRNIFTKGAWTPIPSGDGQKLSVQYQSNGRFYHSYNFSFTEPWLGGKRRNQFSVSFYNSFISNGSYNPYTGFIGGADSSYLRTMGGSISLGKTLHWPDDYFSLIYTLNYQQYKLKNYQFFYGSPLNNGYINNLSLKVTLSRSSAGPNPIYPTSGSNIVLSGQFTPPYSLFQSDEAYNNKTLQEKFKFIEYQKYRFNADWYVPLGKEHGSDHKQFVLKASAKFGFLGRYNSNVQLSPFERFEIGGDGLSNYAIYGKDIISQRGYEVYYSSDPKNNATTQPLNYQGFTIFNKFTLELRYPITLAPSSTIFALAFFDAANGYNGIKNYNPFLLRRDAGIGMRFYLPMFGLLGFDYGIGFDRITPGSGLKNATKFSFMLGYEPE